jgi:hypothetical protein
MEGGGDAWIGGVGSSAFVVFDASDFPLFLVFFEREKALRTAFRSSLSKDRRSARSVAAFEEEKRGRRKRGLSRFLQQKRRKKGMSTTVR